MKDLTWQEISLVNGAKQYNNCLVEEKSESWAAVLWEQLKLDERQWSTFLGMGMQAIISHNLPDGPAKSAANMAGYVFVSVACNTIL